MTFPSILILVFAAILGGAISIQYYVTIRNPRREDLENFAKSLPQLLRVIYFNELNAIVYDGQSRVSAINYLLRQKNSIFFMLMGWLVTLAIFLFPQVIVLLRDFASTGYFLPAHIVDLVLFVVVLARVSLFGIRIKRSIDNWSY
jgi:hypothetical protein